MGSAVGSCELRLLTHQPDEQVIAEDIIVPFNIIFPRYQLIP